jgi:hypothetical protein
MPKENAWMHYDEVKPVIQSLLTICALYETEINETTEDYANRAHDMYRVARKALKLDKE